jgi:hypothetical protein
MHNYEGEWREDDYTELNHNLGVEPADPRHGRKRRVPEGKRVPRVQLRVTEELACAHPAESG